MTHVTPSELVLSWGWKVLDRDDDDDDNDGEEVVVQRTRSIASSSSLLLLARAAAESNEDEDEDEIECRLTQLLSSLSHLSFNESSPPSSRGITTATIAYNATSPPPSALLLMVDWIWNCFTINGNCNSKSTTDNHNHHQQQHLASSLSSFIHHKEWMIAVEAMSLLLFSIVPHSSSSASSCTTTSTGTTAATATTTTWSTIGTPIHQHCLTISSWRLHAIVLDAWIEWDNNNRSNITNINNHWMVDNVTHKLMLAHVYLLLMNLSMKQHGNNGLSLLSPPPSSVTPSSSSSSSTYVFRPRRWQSIICHTIRCYQQLCSYYQQQQQQQQQMNKTMNEKKDKEIDSDDDVDDNSRELSLTSIIVLSQLSIMRLWSHYLLPTCIHLLHRLHHAHHRQQQHQQQHNTNSMCASFTSSSSDHIWWWNHVMGIQTVALLATTTQLIQYVTCHWICRQYWKMWNHHDDGRDHHDHDKNHTTIHK
jgi:hypothetical protein